MYFLPGRGALEIDILEVLPGSYGPNYKEDKVPPRFAGQCPPDFHKCDMVGW